MLKKRQLELAKKNVDEDLSVDDLQKFMDGLEDGTYCIVTEEDQVRYDLAKKRLARERPRARRG